MRENTFKKIRKHKISFWFSNNIMQVICYDNYKNLTKLTANWRTLVFISLGSLKLLVCT